MSHCHDCSKRNSSDNIKTAFFLNFVFTIIEFVGGLMTNSVAIMSDAVHDLGDSFSLGLAWFLESFSTKQKSHRFSYGYQRFSLLGAMINLLILFIGSVYIVWQAIPRLFSPEIPHVSGMLWLSILGIAVNGFAVWKTMHSKKLNEQVVSLHMREDVLGRIAVLIVSVVMMMSELFRLDPLLSLVITAVIMKGVWQRGKETLSLFLQGAPSSVDIDFVRKMLLNNKNIHSVHDIRLRSLDGENHILTAHIVLDTRALLKKHMKIKRNIKSLLKEYGIRHATLEIESKEEQCKDC